MGVGVYTPKNFNTADTDDNDIWDQIAGYDDIKQVYCIN